MDAMRQADVVGAGRDKSLIYAVVTKVTFVGNILGIVKRDGIVGASVDTGLTTGAQFVVHENNAVIALVDRLFRADIRTGGIIAMPAQVHLKIKFGFIISQPGTILFD
jgi:hypothetical protein